MISTVRLTLRRVCAEDWQAIQAIWAAVAQTPAARYDRPNDTSPEAVRRRIEKWASFAGSEVRRFYAVCLEGQVIGYISAHQRDNACELGYCFHPAWHGQGYARESLAALLEALEKEGIPRFTAGTALANTPSVRLLTSLGFRQTGTEQVSFWQDAHGEDIVFEGGIFEKP